MTADNIWRVDNETLQGILDQHTSQDPQLWRSDPPCTAGRGKSSILLRATTTDDP